MKNWLNYWIVFIVCGTVFVTTGGFAFFSWPEIMSGLFFNLLIFVLPVWFALRSDRKRKGVKAL